MGGGAAPSIGPRALETLATPLTWVVIKAGMNDEAKVLGEAPPPPILTPPGAGSFSQTSVICASLIRMPHNPNTLHGNLFYQFLLFLFTMLQ